MKSKIESKVRTDCNSTFLNSKDNTLYFIVNKEGVCQELLRYNIEKEQVVDYETFSDFFIKNPAWLIIEDNEVYLGDLTKNGYDVYSYNYYDKKLTLVTSGLQCGIMPKVFKQSDEHYIFIDNGSTAQNSSNNVVADVHNVTLDEYEFSSEKSKIQAYPEQTKAYKQDTNISYAYWNR